MSETALVDDGTTRTGTRPPHGRSRRNGRAPVPAPWRSPDVRAADGKNAPASVRRSIDAEWTPPPDRRDPVAQLEAQTEGRVAELIPIRYGRMLASPYAFYRGSAVIMASDLAQTPESGPQAQLCGDAHLSNFGGFASPDRTLVS